MDELAELFSVVAVSPLYVSVPVGGPAQDRFLNAVVVVETQVSPDEMLEKLQELEAAFGRIRRIRWGPRTLDLDVIASDQPPVSSPDLVVPHPRAFEREFVLRPLCDLWPDVDVGSGSARDALDSLEDQGVELHSESWWTHWEP